MGNDIKLTTLNSNMILYSWLSKALDYPTPDFIETLIKGELINSVDTKDFRQLKEYIDSFNSTEELLLELQREYTRLCYVSKPRLVPLFESVYKEGKLFQDSTFQIARLYDEAGLRLENDFKLPPDHITLELEFMAYLIYQEIEAIQSDNLGNVELAVRLQKEALLNHLGNFGLGFAEKMMENANNNFFKSTASILRDFLTFEVQAHIN